MLGRWDNRQQTTDNRPVTWDSRVETDGPGLSWSAGRRAENKKERRRVLGEAWVCPLPVRYLSSTEQHGAARIREAQGIRRRAFQGQQVAADTCAKEFLISAPSICQTDKVYLRGKEASVVRPVFGRTAWHGSRGRCRYTASTTDVDSVPDEAQAPTQAIFSLPGRSSPTRRPPLLQKLRHGALPSLPHY